MTPCGLLIDVSTARIFDATKAAENTGALDRRIGELAELDRRQVPDHTLRLITTCRTPDSLCSPTAHLPG